MIKGFKIKENLFFNGFPKSISLEVTNRCNLRCSHCSHTFRKKMFTGDMSQEVFNLVKPHLGQEIVHVSLNGLGEPLISSLWSDMLSDCLKIEGLKISFITNGTIPMDISDYLFEGKIDVTFSIDGATAETYKNIRRNDLFGKVIAQIRSISSIKRKREIPYPKLSAIYVVTTRNMHEMPSFVQLCGDIGIDTVFFTNLVAHDYQQFISLSAFFSPDRHDQYLINAVKLGKMLNVEVIHMGTFNKDLLPQNRPLDSWLYKTNNCSIRCAMIESWCMVTYAGHIQVCCAPDSLIAGDLRENSLMDIWNGHVYRRLKTGIADSFEKTCGHMCNLRQTISLDDIRGFYCPVKETYNCDRSLIVRQPYELGRLNELYISAIKDASEGFYKIAINKCEEIIMSEPFAFEAWNLKGIALHLNGQNTEAAGAFISALGIKVDYQEALHNIRLLSPDIEISGNLLTALLPEPFNYYKAILRSDHLHFGLWDRERKGLTIEEAQDNLFQKLCLFLPPTAHVLDVGCGLGFSSAMLAQRGYKVTAIAPSEGLINYAKDRYGDSGVDFRALSFFDDDNEVFSDGKYDVLLFQESLQYLAPLGNVFKKVRALLKDSGVLIICDEVCYDPIIKPQTAVHLSEHITIGLSEAGFKITNREYVGNDVSPTCDWIINTFSSRFEEIVSLCGNGERLQYFLDGWKMQRQWYEDHRFGYEIISAKKDEFFIKTYQEGDENTILPAFNRIFNVNRSMEHWLWKYRDNPYGSYKISEMLSPDGRLAAHYAGYPVNFYNALHKSDVMSYQIGDTMTEPQFRRIGIGRTGLLARLANYYYARFCINNVPFIYGFNTGKIKKLGTLCLRYEYTSPVSFFSRDLLKNPIDSHRFFKRLLNLYRVEKVKAVSEQWDKFFYSVAEYYSLLVKRDSAYIKWRYLDCPDRVHHIYTIKKGREMVGWGVFTRVAERIIWGDSLFHKAHCNALTELLRSVINDETFSGCTTIEGWFSYNGARWFADALINNHFIKTDEPDDLYPCFVFLNDTYNTDYLEEKLYYTKGDSDLF